MATIRSEGLHHAVSLGNIDATTQANFNLAARNYESEDENMGRMRGRQPAPYSMKPSIYSKEDIIDQYCLTDRQLNSIEPPRRDRFFGCWSTRSQQSFLGVCVGRRAPSDENLQDYAPINRHPRFPQKPINNYDDEDIDSSYFRRKPTSFLSSSDAKRYTWMPADEDAVRLEGPRLIRPFESNGGPYVVGSYPPKSSSFLSQSSEQITGSYRCPAHTGLLPPAPPPPSNSLDTSTNAPRTKHVSFARSLTLASFDEAMGAKSGNRMLNARSQERLIGGKKPTITIQQQPLVQNILQMSQVHQPLLLHQQQQQQQQQQQLQHDFHIEKQKRNIMKTQATQTEIYLAQKAIPSHHLSLSPRTVHRVRMVSQGAQTNGMNGKKLTKSYSEMGRADACVQHEDGQKTQSEDSPKSPLDIALLMKPNYMTTAEVHSHSRTSSRQSQLETSRSDTMSTDNFFIDSFHSQDSTNTLRSIDIPLSKTSYENSSSNNYDSQDNIMISRRGSHTLQTEPIFIGRNELEHMRARPENGYEYESHSLPRRTCIHHKSEEYHTHSLPRREHHHHYIHDHPEPTKMSNGNIPEQVVIMDGNRRMSAYTIQDIQCQPSYVNVVPDTYSLSRRSSTHQQQVPSLSITASTSSAQQSISSQQVPPSDDMCSTCESETDSNQDDDDDDEEDDDEEGEEEEEEEEEDETDHDEEEQEIFIDFKPRLSPAPSPSSISKKKKKLTKAMSEGEMLVENNKRDKHKQAAVSEADLKPVNGNYKEHLQYNDLPIRDEAVFKTEKFMNTSQDNNSNVNSIRYSRETFRKRSVSLEDPMAKEEVLKPAIKNFKKQHPSAPESPDLSTRGKSQFPSTDSITNDGTRGDHSDGIWNESQVTVLPVPPSPPGSKSLLTPSTKRKNILQQQRSSLDIEALDIEDFADQPLPPLPPIAQPLTTNQQKSPFEQHNNNNNNNTTISTTTQTTCLSTIKTSTSIASTTTPTGIVKPTPSINVTQTHSMEKEEKAFININQRSKPSSPSKRKDIKKHMQHKNKKQQHSTILDRNYKSNESLESSIRTSTESNSNRGEMPKSIEMSEGSTTEDYATCTDNSKRQHHSNVPGIRTYTTKGTTISSTTQVPGAAQSSQTMTIDGSSFESASSFHSLARVEAISDDMQPIEEKPIPKASPAHSVSSSSSGSYRMPMKTSSPSRPTHSKALAVKKGKHTSHSDEDRSEKILSSSHDEKDYNKAVRIRRSRDWSEEERRRKKGTFKLEFEKDSIKPLITSPLLLRQPGAAIKKISPDDKVAMNILDGASPSKQKRFRPKTRKTPRTRTISGDDGTLRRSKTPVINKSPEKPPDIVKSSVVPTNPHSVSKLSPSKYHKPCQLMISPSKQKKTCSTIQRLKAISTESLRSVSPGSDSVFYSEADILDHQIHCHHCGKEVEASVDGSEESVLVADDGPDIVVQPPAGFADSPNAQSKSSPGLKYHKRFQSEERKNGKKTRNGRAKSEERGTEDPKKQMRAAGSSPCVAPVKPIAHEHAHDPDMGIYRASYTLGAWICIADRDSWRRNEVTSDKKYIEHTERRGSTDSEKDFRKKYQAITHRLVHRKSCVEMFRRQSSNSFETDKHVIVQRLSGEFGFRIHGSKPVVVSAIEPSTPAETSGLEVGDIIISVNGITVVDKTHSEVVKLAHAGSDTLELEVARAFNMLSPVNEPKSVHSNSLYAGYLWRKSGHHENFKWIRRWFCFRPDQCLYYYKTETDLLPVGVVLLTNHVVAHSSYEKSGRPFAITIEFSDSKLLNLAADTEETANRWVAIMNHAAEQKDPWLEACTRNLRYPPGTIIKPDCFGYLNKQGTRWRSWTKRYFVLKDTCLYFFYEPNSKSAIGMVCLQGYRVQPFTTGGGKKYAFELIPPEPKYRNYNFSTDSEMDKKRWVAALEYSIDRWMKAN